MMWISPELVKVISSVLVKIILHLTIHRAKARYAGKLRLDVAWTLSEMIDMPFVIEMLRKLDSVDWLPGSFLLHSDQGWQYQQAWYVEQLRGRENLQSMLRKGNCLDNCIMESFFGTMKNEMLYGHESEYRSFESFAKAFDEYIAWYNGARIRYQKSMKKWMPPLACFEASFGGHPYGSSL